MVEGVMAGAGMSARENGCVSVNLLVALHRLKIFEKSLKVLLYCIGFLHP